MLFLHIPKNAGTSIREATGLRETGHQPLRWWGKGLFYQKVDTTADIFAAVRNPYDRIISIFYFLKKAHENKKSLYQHRIRRDFARMTEFANVNDFIDALYHFPQRFKHLATDDERNRFVLWQTQCFYYPQVDFLNDGDGQPISDKIKHILRCERLGQDWSEMMTRNGYNQLPHKNKSKLRPATPWQDELTAESIAKIGELYADDFEHLNYERIS